MDLLFLGTSSATPTKTRNVSGLAVIETAGRAWYLVDCGEATQHRLLHTRLSIYDLEAIFITHVHGDHCYGLPGLLASAGLSGRSRPLQIIAPAGIEGWLGATLLHTQLLLPFELHFVATESLTQWRRGDLRVDTVALSHRVPSYAYGFSEHRLETRLDIGKLHSEEIPQGPLWGRLQKGEDVAYQGRTLKSADFVRHVDLSQRIVIAGDNDRPELLRQACGKAQVLVHESTYTTEVTDRLGTSNGHSTAAGIASFAETIGLPNLVLTHFSARYQAEGTRHPSIEDIRAEAAARYRGRLFLADDLARYRLAKSGELARVA